MVYGGYESRVIGSKMSDVIQRLTLSLKSIVLYWIFFIIDVKMFTRKHGLYDADWNATDKFDKKQHGNSGCEDKSENLCQIEDRFCLLLVGLFVGLFIGLSLFRDVRNEYNDQNDAQEWAAGSQKWGKLFTERNI